MKTIRQGFRSLAFVLSLSALSGPAYGQEIALTTGSDYAPYTSPDLPEGGVISQLVSKVFSAAGYQAKLQFHPWKRGYLRVAETKDDATFPYAWSEERAQQFHYSRAINRIFIRVYTRHDSQLTFTQPEDLAGKVYCQPLGYQTEPELTAMKDRGRLTRYEAPDMDGCFRLLSKKRVDFVISNDRVAAKAMERTLKPDEYASIQAAKIPFREISEYLIVSRKHSQGTEIINAFNSSYEELLQSGQLDQIWVKHLGDRAKAVR